VFASSSTLPIASTSVGILRETPGTSSSAGTSPAHLGLGQLLLDVDLERQLLRHLSRRDPLADAEPLDAFAGHPWLGRSPHGERLRPHRGQLRRDVRFGQHVEGK